MTYTSVCCILNTAASTILISYQVTIGFEASGGNVLEAGITLMKAFDQYYGKKLFSAE